MLDLHGDMSRLREFFGRYLGDRNLNVGCALRPEPGFVNLDCDAQNNPDVVWDLERTPLPFGADEFDCVFGSHVFEHIRNFVPLVEDFHRILKPGGHLISVTPYLGSDDAWSSPHHVRGFDENTWAYFDQRLYQQDRDNSGFGAQQNYRADFQVQEIRLVPYPEFAKDPELEFKKRHWRNVIREVHAVVRKA